MRGERAKQTQFRPPREEVGRGRPTYEEPPGPNVQNEANLARPGQGRVSDAWKMPNKTPTTKVRESGFDPRFWADTNGRFGRSGLLSGASNKPNLHRSDVKGKSFNGKELW